MSRLRFALLLLVAAMLVTVMAPAPAAADVQIMAANFLGQYYNNTDLSGAPVLTRSDPSINFSWGTGSPHASVTPDTFSARWTGSFPITTAGTYVFSLTTDDGARLWVDGTLVIDKWFPQAATTYTASVPLSSATHVIKVEYYEQTGLATIALSWGLAGSSETFSAEYYNNMTLSGAPVVQRVDAQVDFDWSTGSPAPAIPPDSFSARWTGIFSFPADGDYTFHVYVDDGVRVSLDGWVILDEWYPQAPTNHSMTRAVSAGAHEIKVEYFEQGGIALITFGWHPAAAAADVIVDDLSPQFTKGGPFYQAAIGYNGHIYWTRNATSTQENWGRWKPVLPVAGQYEVYVYIPSNHGTTRFARYSTFHNAKWNTVTVNQYIYYDAWVSLGTFDFNASGNEFVFLNDVTGEPYLLRQIAWDAVKWVYRGP